MLWSCLFSSAKINTFLLKFFPVLRLNPMSHCHMFQNRRITCGIVTFPRTYTITCRYAHKSRKSPTPSLNRKITAPLSDVEEITRLYNSTRCHSLPQRVTFLENVLKLVVHPMSPYHPARTKFLHPPLAAAIKLNRHEDECGSSDV